MNSEKNINLTVMPLIDLNINVYTLIIILIATHTIAILCIKYPIKSKFPNIFPRIDTITLNIHIFVVVLLSFILSLNITIIVSAIPNTIIELVHSFQNHLLFFYFI